MLDQQRAENKQPRIAEQEERKGVLSCVLAVPNKKCFSFLGQKTMILVESDTTNSLPLGCIRTAVGFSTGIE